MHNAFTHAEALVGKIQQIGGAAALHGKEYGRACSNQRGYSRHQQTRLDGNACAKSANYGKPGPCPESRALRQHKQIIRPRSKRHDQGCDKEFQHSDSAKDLQGNCRHPYRAPSAVPAEPRPISAKPRRRYVPRHGRWTRRQSFSASRPPRSQHHPASPRH